MSSMDINERQERYTKAFNKSQEWWPELQTAYEFSFPNRDNFYEDKTVEVGESKVTDLYDSTAVKGLQSFANNIQGMILPAFQEAFKFIPGYNVKESEVDQAKENTQDWTDTFFRYFNKSNISQQLNSSLKDYGISNGIILVHEGDDNKPFVFESIPFEQIAFEIGINGQPENIWRRLKKPIDQIKRLWPNAILPNVINKDSRDEIEIIEGIILTDEEDEQNKWLYYVSINDHRDILLEEKRNYNPFIIYRFEVSTGEVNGRGPILTALPFIKLANIMSRMEVKAARFRAFPMYTAADTGVTNPYTLRLEPGSIIPIEPNFISNPPIQELSSGGNPQFVQLSLANLQQKINDILLADPLGPITPETKTATEQNIRNQTWIRQSQSFIGRITNELLNPLVNICIRILQKKGLLQFFRVDSKTVDIEFLNQIAEVQSQIDVQNTLTWIQQIQSMFGPEGVLFFTEFTKIGTWLGQKQHIDTDLISNDAQKQLKLQSFQQVLSQQAGGGQQAANQAQPPQTGGSPLQSIGSPQ